MPTLHVISIDVLLPPQLTPSILQKILLELIQLFERVTEQPPVAVVLPPLVLAILAQLHQFRNVVSGAHLRPPEEIASLGPAVGLRFVADAFPRGEFGNLAENLLSRLGGVIGELVD